MTTPRSLLLRFAQACLAPGLLVLSLPSVVRAQEGGTEVSEPAKSSDPSADAPAPAPLPGDVKAAPRAMGPPPDVSKELKKPIYKKMSLSIGSPHSGRQVRAKKLHPDPNLHLLKRGSEIRSRLA